MARGGQYGLLNTSDLDATLGLRFPCVGDYTTGLSFAVNIVWIKTFGTFCTGK
jgi:hypothetical protein